MESGLLHEQYVGQMPMPTFDVFSNPNFLLFRHRWHDSHQREGIKRAIHSGNAKILGS